MPSLRLIRFQSIRTKLMFLFVLIGIIPAAIIAAIAYNQSRHALEKATGSRMQAIAGDMATILDDTFFERFGDVAVFAGSPQALQDAAKVTAAADFYTRQYGVYDLMLVADATGTIVAANSVNAEGKPINAGNLIGTSVKGEPWFEEAMKLPAGHSYFGDAAVDGRVARAAGTNGQVVSFSSPICDADGKTTRVWGNFVSWDRTVKVALHELQARREARGAKTAASNLINHQGLLLSDADPSREFTFNLVEAGLESAKKAVSEDSGCLTEANRRTGIDQINGYARTKGKGDFKGGGWGILIRQDASEAFQAATELAVFVAILTCGMAGAICVLGYFVARSLARPLIATANTLEQIAAGDLTRRVEVENTDEIGRVGECVNKLSSNLQTVVKRIADSSRELASSSEELSATASEMAKNADGTTTQSATVAAAAEEMATNMRSMAAGTEEMSSNIKTVAAAIEELTASVSEIARNAESSSNVANEAAELANASNEKVRQLGEAADEIGKVIDVIQDIADQTNLLALNATIEAARAGEAGKGFAVVATEVKELAKQSAAATDSIRQRIQGMQGSTTDTVKAIAEIGTAIKNVNQVAGTIAKMVDQQSTATQEISRNIVQTSEAASSVSRGVTESASACQEITKTIVRVDEAAKSTAAGATQTRSSGGRLAQLAESLQGLVVEFRT